MSLEITTKPDVTAMYETTFIAVPELSEQDYRKLTSKFEKLIKDNGGKIINVEYWGSKKLAYPIGKHTSGYYTYIEFSAPGAFISKLKLEYGYDESIIRHLTVVLEKHAVEYNNRRRNREGSEKITPSTDAADKKSGARRKKTLANQEEGK